MTWTSAARFYRQLSLVHNAGIAVAQAVEMAGVATIGHHRELAPEWARGCAGGSQLADQLERTGEEPLAVALMRAGEKSGRIPEMSRMLAEHYEHRLALRDLVIARLVYPLLLLHLALMAPAVPKVFFGSWPAWTLLAGPALIWAITAAVIGGERASRRAGLTSRLMVQPPLAFLGMPLIVCNTAHVLRAALTAGMLVPDALELAARGCGNRLMAQRLRDAGSSVRNGRTPNLAAALGQCGFPSTELGLIANAEFAGKLEEVLLQVATVAEESFRSRAMWTAKVLTGIIYGVALLVTAAVILAGAMAYVGQINQAAQDLE
jgi:type II secretory pathway component PulF